MTKPENQSITSGQKKRYLRVVKETAERALRDANLSKDGMDKLLSSRDEFRAKIRPPLLARITECSLSDLYSDEEIDPASVYLREYPSGFRVKGVAEQMSILREFFPDIGNADETLAERPLPILAEGYGVIPRWERIASTYGEAVEIAFKMIESRMRASKQECINFEARTLGAEFLRQSERTVIMFQQLVNQQKDHEVLIVPIQFGFLHRGKSVRRARMVFNANEFGLGAFATGILILTHPERLNNQGDLSVICAGDESAPTSDGDFCCAPRWEIRGAPHGLLALNADGIAFPDAYAGSATAFLSE
ncbi:hypothetical protein EXS71_03815 [Candidatus Uhrbacteria bacterium]|nr:hypothetical protein [Candidatus Uhrbacteria bacterium]